MLLSGAFEKGAYRAEVQIIRGDEPASGTGAQGPAEDLWGAHDPAAGTHGERERESKGG